MNARHERRDFIKALAAGSLCAAIGPGARGAAREPAELILRGGRITTLDPSRPEASAAAVKTGRFTAVGDDAEVMNHAGPGTRVIDLGGRRVIPGLIDGHTHLIRGGLNYNLELRWDGVPSLADAMRMLRAQVARTPAPQWVRVIGGFNEYQFAERRMPTLAELNTVAPETPVFILRLYDRALLNRAALRAVGFTKDTPDPPGGHIERDKRGEPTGLLLAKPNAALLYATLARGPALSFDDQVNSTRHFMRELNRLGITSVMDAGGGFQSYPDGYQVVEHLARANQLTLRIAYNLFTQRPKEELADFQAWAKVVRPGQGIDGRADLYRHNGAGEMLVYSAADFEDFREPRPELPANMEADLERVVRHLAEVQWPFRMHATYDETIDRALDVFERVHHEVPLDSLNWLFDHAETITPRNIDRVKALGGGIAIQNRMAFQGEDFVQRYGGAKAAESPPLSRILTAGVPLGAGTDATRVSSYNPWVCIHWLVSGKSLGGSKVLANHNRLDRITALRLWTEANTWFSREQGRKGMIRVDQFADLAVLSADYLDIAEDEIRNLSSSMTLLGGDIVHAAGPFSALAPPLPPASPGWSPVNRPDGRTDSRAANFRTACGCWMG